MADMYKLCEQCGTQNSAVSVVCVKPECRADLTYAPEIYSTEPSGSTSHPVTDCDTLLGPEKRCACRISQPGAADPLTCWSCGLPIRTDAAQADGVALTHACIVLPGNVKRSIGKGLLLGRDVRGAPAPIRGLLTAFPGLSRVHAWVGCDGQDVTVLDLGSRNGTWLNNRKLTPGVPMKYSFSETCVELRLGHSLVSTLRQELSE